jgi:phenylalanyl-tRNA synthetase beta chain
MRISYNWLKEFIDINHTPEALGALLTQTGLEVESIEKVEKIPGGLEGVVIGEVMECVPHPDADRLRLTKVDAGQGQLLPIVCGAPNVAVGQKVVVALVGTTLYPKGAEPLKIKKAKIRGAESEGMICAEDELGMGTDHSGILVLNTDLPNGTPAADYFHPETDYVFEIGLTPNRGDAASHLGVARDIRAVTGASIHKPEPKKFDVKVDRPVSVEVKDLDKCPRYSGITIRGVKVAPSPEWLQWRLRSIGLEPINNVVDITNYICHGLGQPLHAFDADAIAQGKVLVGTLAEGTPFVTLDDKERKLGAEDLMICDPNGGMCIAGVFGGAGSGIKDTTTAIFLESAYFSPETIRNSVQRHGLTTDASFRFERGADPEMTVEALHVAVGLILEICGGQVASEVVDVYPNKIAPVKIPTTFRTFHRLIGKELSPTEITGILKSLDIRVENETKEDFTAVVPAYRNDVTREADLVEEVLRIYGFNNIELDEFSSTNYLAEFDENEPYKVRERVSRMLAGKGFLEILTNSLVHPEHHVKAAVNDHRAVEIINKSSEELGFMKASPLYSALEVVRHNLNRKMTDLKFFELAKSYRWEGNQPAESYRFCLYMTGDVEEENWMRTASAVSLPDVRAALEGVLMTMGVKDVQVKPLEGDKAFAYGLSFSVGQEEIGRVGLLTKEITRYFEIGQPVFYAELDWEMGLSKSARKFVFKELSKFPEVRRDLSLVLDKQISFDRIEQIAFNSAKKLLNRVNVFSVYEGEKLGAGKKSYAVSYYLQDQQKTLTDHQIDQVMNGLISAYEKDLGAIIRK